MPAQDQNRTIADLTRDYVLNRQVSVNPIYPNAADSVLASVPCADVGWVLSICSC